MNPKTVLKYASDQGAKFVSVRFTDLPGSWQHLTFPIGELGEEQFEDGFGFDDIFAVTKLCRHRKNDAFFFGCPDHCACFGNRETQRLFAENVNAFLHKIHRNFGMQIWRRGDNHGVHRPGLDELLAVAEDFERLIFVELRR